VGILHYLSISDDAVFDRLYHSLLEGVIHSKNLRRVGLSWLARYKQVCGKQVCEEWK
jgi:hypothetical protein